MSAKYYTLNHDTAKRGNCEHAGYASDKIYPKMPCNSARRRGVERTTKNFASRAGVVECIRAPRGALSDNLKKTTREVFAWEADP